METVTVTRGTGAYIPSRIGGASDTWQEPVSAIRVNGQPRIIVDGTRSEVVLSSGRVNVSDDVPADSRGDHAGIVAWWTDEITRQDQERAYVAREDVFVTDQGQTVEAPGFDTLERLTAYVTRARAAQLRTRPAGTPGVVMVSSGSSPAVYAVTRHRCGCAAGQTHGYCQHRALAIWLHDVEGVPVCRVATIGTDASGLTVARPEAA